MGGEVVTTLSKKLTPLQKALIKDLEEAEHKEWDSLGSYKFTMFGYWAAVLDHINSIGGFKKKNPWGEIVKIADNSPLAEQAKQAYESHR